MIGDGWDGEPAPRPGPDPGHASRRRIGIVTGSRADFGLLQPVMRAVRDHPELELAIIAAGAHLIQPATTYRDVRTFAVEIGAPIADAVPMQTAGKTGRLEDAEALGAGVSRFARSFGRLRPDWVVVLGDRIEAFAAASAASVGGIALAHIHGGDRAEGVADEAMRHAITKLAHLHLAATAQSAERIKRMGERPEHIHTVGSPAIDGLDAVEPMSDAEAAELGDPNTVILLHPAGLAEDRERATVEAVIYACEVMSAGNVLCLAPNFDPGRSVIDERLRAYCSANESGDAAAFTYRAHGPALGEHAHQLDRRWTYREHLPRPVFLRLLRRLAEPDRVGVLAGNSSAGLIEAAAFKLRVLNVGPRQGGRETPENVHSWAPEATDKQLASVPTAFDWLNGLRVEELPDDHHPYGDGRSGPRIAALLAATDPHDERLLRKRCAY